MRKFKTIIAIIIFVWMCVSGGYAFSSKGTVTDLVVFIVSATSWLAWVFFAWKVKLTEKSSQFIKFINTEAF